MNHYVLKINVLTVSLEEEAGLPDGEGKALGVNGAFINQGEHRSLTALLLTGFCAPQSPLSLPWQSGTQTGCLHTTFCSCQGLLRCLLTLFPGTQPLRCLDRSLPPAPLLLPAVIGCHVCSPIPWVRRLGCSYESSIKAHPLSFSI